MNISRGEKILKTLIAAISFLMVATLYAGDLKDDLKNASDDSAKISVVESMGNTKEQKYQKPLIDTLTNGESSKLRAVAATALGKMNAGINELQKAYETDDVYVREASIDALAEIGNAKSQSTFENATKDKNEKIRFSGIKGLSKTGRIGNASIFRNALEWKDKTTQIYAIRGIGNINAYNEWNYVKPFCNNADKDFVLACLYTAGKIQYTEALNTIEKHMASPDSDISKAAFEATSFYKPQVVIPTLIRFKRDNPTHPSLEALSATLKKLKAAKQYAIVKVSDKLNLRSKANERSEIVISLKANSVVEVLGHESRKYIITNSAGEEIEDFWYQVKTEDGKKGFLFGSYLDVINSN
jgi:HEAT repeat protein